MRKLLNTLYVLSEDKYLALEGETLAVREEGSTVARFPLHNLEGIVTCGHAGASPALMGACASRNIALVFLSRSGKYLASVCGEMKGNIFLRREQYRIADDEGKSVKIARNMIVGKIYNSKWVLERATRDHSMQVDVESIKAVTLSLDNSILQLRDCDKIEQIVGVEGNAASQYFSVFDELILQNKEMFFFHQRNRRPPLDNVNAMLSFMYSILANECASALSTVGLDPYLGFMHQARPGRNSLALDLMEEVRSVLVDRFVLSLINKRMVSEKDFIKKENEAVLMTDEGRKTILTAWWNRKKEVLVHPFLEEKIEWGLVPYVQALLLARYIRGDLDEYPVFLWK
ncbi:type I-C CRISPR-associated endonuclease Cas1c [Aequitasia blattaphilus]|uniref:CRISPR-associated endonuclease Cas1 n=1 Tax=Aequitasia blattaphilus TaxID=2949332 RepID=A0ABT1E8J0_9FIRM|nr:type I-C CRISPR-associated endonuclease Cas1c [Aequitasia blattaphilus]MCP1102026.1 type I-C CRISPR-associated endonuclease Cas1c [Aequitasia blattaphilus]MCR8614666.1 type I-C CRISPR-associated endonuclease Cas1c [Aequitasia blattaphilus]